MGYTIGTMLNPFPDLLALAFFAPFFVRLGTGIVFLSFAFAHAKNRTALETSIKRHFEFLTFAPWLLIGAEGLIAIALIAGFYTQVAALVGIILCIKLPFVARWYKQEAFAPHDRLLYILLGLASLSLMVSGAGAFAIDLPL